MKIKKIKANNVEFIFSEDHLNLNILSGELSLKDINDLSDIITNKMQFHAILWDENKIVQLQASKIESGD